MKKTILIICLFINCFAWAQTGAINIDFETGDYTGWQLTSGLNNNSVQPLSSTVTVGGGALNLAADNCTVTTSQSIMTGVADPMCLLNLTSPLGGNYVARLNNYCAGAKGSILEQTFTVDNANYMLHMAYLIVLQQPGSHILTDQPYFSIDVLDQTGNVIPSNSYSTLTPSFTGPPGFSVAASGAYYKPWTLDTIDLSSYIGQNVTLKFMAVACIQGGHSGYAYVDAKLSALTTGINNSSNSLLTLSPNPVSETLMISLANKEAFDFEILDILGQEVIKKQSLKNQQIDVSHLQNGTYFLKAHFSNHIVIKKFIKQ